MARELEQKWREKLTRAALPGAVRVMFEWTRTEDGTSFTLRSRDADGNSIGDSSDYDILKARISPLEDLAESEGFGDVGEKRRMALDLETGTLVRS